MTMVKQWFIKQGFRLQIITWVLTNKALGEKLMMFMKMAIQWL